jgi:hypothetical protein
MLARLPPSMEFGMFVPRRIAVVPLMVCLAVLWGVTAIPADARVQRFGHVFL